MLLGAAGHGHLQKRIGVETFGTFRPALIAAAARRPGSSGAWPPSPSSSSSPPASARPWTGCSSSTPPNGRDAHQRGDPMLTMTILSVHSGSSSWRMSLCSPSPSWPSPRNGSPSSRRSRVSARRKDPARDDHVRFCMLRGHGLLFPPEHGPRLPGDLLVVDCA